MQLLYDNYTKAQLSIFDDNSIGDKVLKYLRNYKFSCSVLLNYDVWEQAQVFASVNFNQKKVNRSLFYDIYGIMIPDTDSLVIPKQNEIYIAHQLVAYLNGNQNSPFRGFVNMLGTGNGFVSQAFLVEQFLMHLSSNGIWADVTLDLKEKTNKKLQNYAAAELSAYLAAIRGTFKKYWPDDGRSSVSVLCKTTGIGAIMRFLKDLHLSMPPSLQNEMKETPSSPFTYAEIITYFSNNIEPLKSYGEILFSTEGKGEFNGTGGQGLQIKLYNKMKELWIKR
jgi:hypothetical protein